MWQSDAMVRRLVALAAAALAAAMATVLPASAMTSSPNDPFFVQGYQWGLTGSSAAINAPAAWPLSTGAGVVVGDVDTGVNFSHPDLSRAGKLARGANFTNCTATPTGAPVDDDVGHGTMTTGLIAASTNNGIGIAGVAPDASVLVVKVLSKATDPTTGQTTGSGCDNDVAAGIRWAVDHGARVINLSIGSEIPLTGGTGDIPSAVDYAAQHGVAMAIAAGNNSLPASDYQTHPIDAESLVVGALGPSGSKAYYSTSLVGVNLYAPGGDDTQGDAKHALITSTGLDPSQYPQEEGTSFAAPHVAGVLALLMSCGLSATAARQRILDTASDRFGLTELNAAAAVSGAGHCTGSASTATSTSASTARSSSPTPAATALSPAAAPAATAAKPPTPTTAPGSPSPSPSATPSPRAVALASPTPAGSGSASAGAAGAAGSGGGGGGSGRLGAMIAGSAAAVIVVAGALASRRLRHRAPV